MSWCSQRNAKEEQIAGPYWLIVIFIFRCFLFSLYLTFHSSIYLFIHLSIFLFILSIYLSISCLFIYPSTYHLSFSHLSIYSSIFIFFSFFIYLFIFLSTYQPTVPICLSIYLSFYQQINQSIFLFIYLYICLSIYLSVFILIYLSILVNKKERVNAQCSCCVGGESMTPPTVWVMQGGVRSIVHHMLQCCLTFTFYFFLMYLL